MCLTFLSPSFKELPGFFWGLADWEKGESQKQTTEEEKVCGGMRREQGKVRKGERETEESIASIS